MDISTAVIKKYLIITVVLAALLALCLYLNYAPTPLKRTHEFVFMSDLIQSLRYQKAAFQKHTEIKPPRFDSRRDADKKTPFLENLKSANADLKKSESLINKYKGSKNPTIKKVASYVLSIYEKQIKLNERALQLYAQVYSPEEMNKLSVFDQGKLTNEAHKIPLERETIDKLLLDASIVATQALYSDRLDKSGQMSFLTVTSKERERLLKSIADAFGAATPGNQKENRSPIDACITSIREVLSSKYKSADEH